MPPVRAATKPKCAQHHRIKDLKGLGCTQKLYFLSVDPQNYHFICSSLPPSLLPSLARSSACLCARAARAPLSPLSASPSSSLYYGSACCPARTPAHACLHTCTCLKAPHASCRADGTPRLGCRAYGNPLPREMIALDWCGDLRIRAIRTRCLPHLYLLHIIHLQKCL